MNKYSANGVRKIISQKLKKNRVSKTCFLKLILFCSWKTFVDKISFLERVFLF